MIIQAKFEKPLSIRIGTSDNVLLSDDKNIPLNPGIMYDSSHYGFVIIVDFNGKQKEVVFPTQCSINAVGFRDGSLKIYEDGKKTPWIFDRQGKLIQSNQDDFTSEFIEKYNNELMNKGTFGDAPIIKNPICLKISRDPNESVILGNEVTNNDNPLYPGAMIGGIHYGFILLIDTLNDQKKLVYPTQNIIDAVGIENDVYGDIKIFEKDKKVPWLFSFDGKFKHESALDYSSNKDNISLSLNNRKSDVL